LQVENFFTLKKPVEHITGKEASVANDSAVAVSVPFGEGRGEVVLIVINPLIKI